MQRFQIDLNKLKRSNLSLMSSNESTFVQMSLNNIKLTQMGSGFTSDLSKYV